MKSVKPHIKAIASDLDGTLLPYHGQFNTADIETLTRLGQSGVVRIIATGRSLWSAQKVLSPDFPIDYLVFSSGAGILNWKTQQLIENYCIPFEDVHRTTTLFKRHNLAFTLHHRSPDNHRFYYHQGSSPHPNLAAYLEHYHPNGQPLMEPVPHDAYSQLLAFMPNWEQFDTISRQVTNMKTIRATSPIDDASIWLECFHPQVSKANGVNLICKHHQISEHHVAAIGNDYNDMDLLSAFHHSAVVANAPQELRNMFHSVRPVNEAGFTDFMSQFTS
ncbi:MAG: HAD family phosphatase [Marinilabiliaceae bacterium]|nr:HAD family phosphatase [Marinilabiliaceae bacterium]